MAGFWRRLVSFQMLRSTALQHNINHRSLQISFGTRLYTTKTLNKSWGQSNRRFAKSLGLLVASGSFFAFSKLLDKFNAIDVLPTVSASDKPPSKVSGANFIADVVEIAAPAVVHIERSIKARRAFTGEEVIVPESNGSGFIVREDGLILTNAHVVGQKAEVTVKLHDGRSFSGTVQAVDRVSDLATVKIEAKDLPVLPLGQSSSVRPGEWVVAMGSPLQLSQTVTCGIVSTPNRSSGELGIHGKGITYIQTDASIDRGNSGGPLVNLDGEAIGINTIKLTPGISFAIPSDYARAFLERAFKIEKRPVTSWFGGSRPAQDISANKGGGQQRRYYIGVQMMTLTSDLYRQLQLLLKEEVPMSSSGVLVVGVRHDSPAHAAGLMARDVIVKVNGQPLASTSTVYQMVDQGKELQLEVQRGPKTLHLSLKPEPMQ